MSRKNKRKKKGLSKGDLNRSAMKPRKTLETVSLLTSWLLNLGLRRSLIWFWFMTVFAVCTLGTMYIVHVLLYLPVSNSTVLYLLLSTNHYFAEIYTYVFQLDNPFEPCDVTLLKNFGEITTKDLQTLVLYYLGCYFTLIIVSFLILLSGLKLWYCFLI